MSAEPGIGSALRSALVDPVRRGTFNLRPHSAQAAGVALTVTGLFTLLIGAVLLATPLRGAGRLTGIDSGAGGGTITLPGVLVPITLALVGVCCAVLLTGALRGHPALTAAAAALSVVILAVIVAASRGADPMAGPTVLGYAAAGLTGVVAAALRRWRGGVVRDLIALLIPTTAALVLAQRAFREGALASGIRLDIVAVALVLTFLATLAIPVAIASGLAAVDAGVGLVTGLVTGLLSRVPAAVGYALGGVLAFGLVLVATVGPGSADLVGLVSGGVILAGAGAAWLLAGNRPGAIDDESPDGGPARPAVGRLALPAAYVLSAPVILGGLLGMVGVLIAAAAGPTVAEGVVGVREFLLTGAGPLLGRLALILALVWIGLRVRPGQPWLAGAAWVTAVAAAASTLDSAGWPWWSWTPGDTADALLLVSLVVIAWAAVRRRRLAVAVLLPVLVLTALLPQADALALPITLLVQGSATAVLVLGLVWSLLTEGAAAHRDTPLLSRDGALLLILGNLLFAATILMWASVGRQPLISGELQAAAGIGVEILGTALVLIVVLSLITGITGAPARTARAPGSPAGAR